MKRQIDIEIMRILAAFFVIFNHTGSNGFFLFASYDADSLPFWAYLCMSIFCTFSVPLFFMISGALMLNKEIDSYRNFILKKVGRIIGVLLFWSIVSYLLQIWSGETQWGAEIFLSRLYTSNWNYSYWYLYSYIAMLLMIPVLQKIAKSLSNKEYIYMYLLFGLFVCVLPVLEWLLGENRYILNGLLQIDWLRSSIFIYPLLGYFLQNKAECFYSGKKLVVCWLLNIVALLLGAYLTYHKSQITGLLTEADSQTFHSTFVLFNSTTIFVTCKYFAKYIRSTWIKKVIISVGGATFGIYLIHAFLLNILRLTRVFETVCKVFSTMPMLSILIYCGIIFVIGYLLTVLLKRIPGLKSLV